MRCSTPRLAARSLSVVLLSLLGSCTLAFSLDPLQQDCAPNEKTCGKACVPNNDPLTGCGTKDDCSPCVIPGGKAKCDEENLCVLDECYYPRESCDDNPYNGCEANLALDVLNCGACGVKACEGVELLHVPLAACIGDPSLTETERCGIAQCDSDWGDCDHNPKSGCEVNLLETAAHCGECTHSCNMSEICLNGTCTAKPVETDAG